MNGMVNFCAGSARVYFLGGIVKKTILPDRWILAAIFFACLLSAHSSKTQAADDNVAHAIFHDGRQRAYKVHFPSLKDSDSPRPLVILLHGANGNAEEIEKMSGMSQKADREDFIVVYPEGTGPNRKYMWNADNCCGDAFKDGVDDIGFIRAMIEKLLTDYPVDPDRIYVAGFSNGAMMAYRLACMLSDKLAAIAPVEGALYDADCHPSDPVSVIAVHGTEDLKILYHGGVSPVPGVTKNIDHSVAYAIQFWAKHNQAKLIENKKTDGSPIIRERHFNASTGAEVSLITVVGGEHVWPDGEGGLNVTDEMWSFFKSHKKAAA